MKLDWQHALIMTIGAILLGYLAWLGRANGNLMTAVVAAAGGYFTVLMGLFKKSPRLPPKKAVESDKAARP
jgi:hypothetical protein